MLGIRPAEALTDLMVAGNDRNDAPTDGLFSVARLLERGVDLDAILGAIVDEVIHRLQADRGTLYLLDRDRQ